MTGHRVKQLREGFGFNAHAFAEILGVHVSTLYRWEQCSTKVEISMDRFQAEILTRLDDYALSSSRAKRRKLSAEVKKVLLAHGGLSALVILLQKIRING